MKIPYAPKSQQLEGMKFVLRVAGFDLYRLAVERLCSAKLMTKSEKYRRIKAARHIMGIPYKGR